jgi:hypothetical protein
VGHAGLITIRCTDRCDTAREREQAELTIAIASEPAMTRSQGVVPRAQAILEAL